MTGLLNVAGGDKPDRSADIIFIHGLDGDAKTTWHPRDKPEGFWPAWLGKDFPLVGLWSLGYAVSSTAWKGHGMPLYDRANWALNVFEQHGIGQRPLGFVCHSLGGLLIKQVLRNASDSSHAAWRAIIDQSRFIVFLSTPHSGANLASWIQYLGKLPRTTVSVRELTAHDPQLRQLNSWYRDHVADLGIKNFVYCEERKTGTGPLGLGGILVVDKTTADPGIAGVTPIVLDEDHVSICKPASKDAQVYHQVRQMIEEMLPMPEDTSTDPGSRPVEIDYPGPLKKEICDRLHGSWEDLADQLDIPEAKRRQFAKGREPHGVWEWLKARKEMARLTPALTAIGRDDLAEELRRHHPQ